MDLKSTHRLNRRRNIRVVARALLKRRHYVAMVEALKQCQGPVGFLLRYATGRGAYPTTISLMTPIGPITLSAYSWHDTRTIYEIFLAHDYEIDQSARIIVDYGSNIGISAAYFLSRNLNSRVYLFEPLSSNAAKLRANLQQFTDRCEVEEVAVAASNMIARFGVEPTGRYCGIDIHTGNYIYVICKDSNHILQGLVDKHGKIDVLKVDVEGMEERIIKRLSPGLASKIGLILVEHRFRHNPLELTYEMSTRGGPVSRFNLRA